MRSLTLLALSGLLLTSIPLAAATDAPTEIICGPLTVSSAIQCAIDIIVNAVTGAGNTAQCVLDVPPGQYPGGVTGCLITIKDGS